MCERHRDAPLGVSDVAQTPPLVGWAPATAREPCPETCPQLGNYDPAERDIDERNRR